MKAEADLKMAMKLQPNDPYIINYLAYSWLDREMNIETAVNLLEKAVELEPFDGYILDSLWMGILFVRCRGPINIFSRKGGLPLPNDPTLNDHLGDAYWKSGRYDEA